MRGPSFRSTPYTLNTQANTKHQVLHNVMQYLIVRHVAVRRRLPLLKASCFGILVGHGRHPVTVYNSDDLKICIDSYYIYIHMHIIQQSRCGVSTWGLGSRVYSLCGPKPFTLNPKT